MASETKLPDWLEKSAALFIILKNMGLTLDEIRFILANPTSFDDQPHSSKVDRAPATWVGTQR